MTLFRIILILFFEVDIIYEKDSEVEGWNR